MPRDRRGRLGSVMFCAIGRSSRMPAPLRSSGTRKMPALTASAEVAKRTGCRRARSSPPAGRSMPKMARASSVRPAPTRPGKPEDLAAHGDRGRPPGRDRSACAALWRTSTTAPRGLRRRRVGDLEVAADHQLDHRVVVDLVALERADQLAVAQHDDAVAGLDDLVQAVRNEDDRDALRLEAGDDLEQLLGLGERQARGRLVEDDEARVEAQRLGDLDHLLLRRARAARPASPARSSRRAGRDRAARWCAACRCRRAAGSRTSAARGRYRRWRRRRDCRRD